MKRSWLGILLILCCIFMLSFSVSATSVPSGYTAISTAEQLMGITNMSGKYILTQDIDLRGKTWMPLGGWNDTDCFSGVFDGNGCTISNLSGSNGLFKMNTGTIKNVTLDSSCLISKTSGSYIAGIAAINEGVIENCINHGSINAGTPIYTGGICGRNAGGTIRCCANTGNITASGYPTSSEGMRIGGICGASLNDYATIDQCWNSGNISGYSYSSYKSVYAGGIVGVIGSSSGTQDELVVSNTFNSGSVHAKAKSNTCAGGIAGELIAQEIKNAYNVGTISVDVTTSSSEYCFAIAGCNVGVNTYSPKGTYANCYYLEGCYAPVYANPPKGTTACTSAQLKQKSTFSGFDFAKIWMIDGGSSYRYPVLRATHDCSHSYQLTKDTATCGSAGQKLYTCSYCGSTYTEPSPTLGHTWGEVSYVWSLDYSACTATRTCERNAADTESENAEITSLQTKAPSCTTYGETTYTAVFSVDWAAEQMQVAADIEPLDHIDENTDHICDRNCGDQTIGIHAAAQGMHTCNYCGEAVSPCADDDSDHMCDICGAAMGEHQAAAGKHTCDYCNETVTQCTDSSDADSLCDVCGTDLFTVTIHSNTVAIENAPADLMLLITGYTLEKMDAVQLTAPINDNVTITDAVLVCEKITIFFVNHDFVPLYEALPVN